MKFDKEFDRIRCGKSGTDKVRILAFGSSNTERFITGQHWFDCFELAIKNKYGRIHHCINSGIGGETGDDLLNRFETDARFYKPDIVFITIGGNDSNPEKGKGDVWFRKNLLALYKKFDAIGCTVIFQTYYAPIPQELNRTHYANFCRLMDITREVATQTGAGLIDHFKLWLPFQQDMPEKHRKIMNDGLHVNSVGNIVLGLYIAKQFECELDGKFYDEAKEYLEMMIKLLT